MPGVRPEPPADPDEPGPREPHDGFRPGGDRGPSGAVRPLPLDPAVSEAVHHVGRAQVERVYAAHRQSWAEALPSLRAAWEEHEDRYPERERATPVNHPDGSWSSGETRRLTPEQNAEATKACADIHAEGNRDVFPAMLQVEAADPARRLVGVEHMLKGMDRLKEKVADALRARPELTATHALSIVPDPVRFTCVYDFARYADGVRADVERIKEIGFEQVKLKNLWSDQQYKGINSQWRRPETGLRIEVQFHTLTSLEAKELTHKAYERIRSTDTSPLERDELLAFQRQANAFVDTPPGTAEIPDFPEK